MIVTTLPWTLEFPLALAYGFSFDSNTLVTVFDPPSVVFKSAKPGKRILVSPAAILDFPFRSNEEKMKRISQKKIRFHLPSGGAFANVIAMALLSMDFGSSVSERLAKTSPITNKPLELRLAIFDA